MRKKSKHIGRLFMLRSVGDESVDILFIMGDNGKSLSDELVCDSDHGEFPGFPFCRSRVYVSPHLVLNLLAVHAAT